jgi:membrane protease YdiL (CAAX protease family)
MDLLRKHATKENILLLSVCLLLPLYMRFSTPHSFDLLFGNFFEGVRNFSLIRTTYHYLTMTLLLLCIPLVLIRTVFKENLSQYGLQLGDQQLGFRITFLLLIPIFFAMFLTAQMPETLPPFFRDIYPSIPEARENPALLFLGILLLFSYYFAFEFFYRGYMLFGLKEKFGAAAAILIQSIPSIIIHFDKPNGELFSSIIAEILFGMLALRTRSILYGVLIHYFVGVSLEIALLIT